MDTRGDPSSILCWTPQRDTGAQKHNWIMMCINAPHTVLSRVCRSQSTRYNWDKIDGQWSNVQYTCTLYSRLPAGIAADPDPNRQRTGKLMWLASPVACTVC